MKAILEFVSRVSFNPTVILNAVLITLKCTALYVSNDEKYHSGDTFFFFLVCLNRLTLYLNIMMLYLNININEITMHVFE